MLQASWCKDEFINANHSHKSYWLLHAWTNSSMLIIFLTKGRIKGRLRMGTTFDLLGPQITPGKNYLSKTVDLNHKGLMGSRRGRLIPLRLKSTILSKYFFSYVIWVPNRPNVVPKINLHQIRPLVKEIISMDEFVHACNKGQN